MWELRHLPAYLIWSQKSCSILAKQLDRLREVGGRIGLDIGVCRYHHARCRTTHLFERVIEATRGDEEDVLSLFRREKKSMAFPARNEDAFSGFWGGPLS